ncbi:tigger transposable element-derived protein 2-like, partial [Aphis craccivora]
MMAWSISILHKIRPNNEDFTFYKARCLASNIAIHSHIEEKRRIWNWHLLWNINVLNYKSFRAWPNQIPRCRKQWDKKVIESAIQAVRQNEMRFLKATKQFKVPRTTLHRLCNKMDMEPHNAAATILGRESTLGDTLESELLKYALLMESKYYGLTRNDLKQMAYQLAVQNKIKHPFLSQFMPYGGFKW